MHMTIKDRDCFGNLGIGLMLIGWGQMFISSLFEPGNHHSTKLMHMYFLADALSGISSKLISITVIMLLHGSIQYFMI